MTVRHATRAGAGPRVEPVARVALSTAVDESRAEVTLGGEMKRALAILHRPQACPPRTEELHRVPDDVLEDLAEVPVVARLGRDALQRSVRCRVDSARGAGCAGGAGIA